MPTQVQFRRGNTAQHSTFTGAIGELTVNTEKNTVVVHDGSTAGGFTLALESSQQDALAYNQANAAFALANSAVATLNEDNKVDKSGDIMTGSLTTSSNVRADRIIANTEFFAGIATEQAVILPDRIAQFTSNSETYVQVNQQNINANGSADFVITADVGSDTTFYTDMGMAGSNYNFYDGFDTPFEPLTGYFLVQGNTGQDGGNMVVGTTSPSTNVQFLVGGFENSNVVLKLEETGAVVKGNVTPLTNNVYFLGSESNRWHSLYVGPGSIDIDGIVLSNNNGQLTITGATDFVVGSSPSTQGISDKANAAFLAANTAITYTDNAIANLINSSPAALDTLSELAAALGNDENFSTTILNTISISGSYANSAFGAANTADQRAVTSGLYANASYSQANTADQKAVTSGSYANSAFGTANTADQRAVTSGVYANSAFALSNSTLQYAESGYAQANTGTILAQSSYDFANTISSGSAQDSTARQSAASAGSYANSAYSQANTGTILAQAAFDSANNVAPQIQPSFDQANTANQSATSAGSYANSAFTAANTADQKAVTSGDYANSAFTGANTADQKAVTSGDYANSAYLQANTATTNAATADQKAVTSGDYANSAFGAANTATTDVATADQRAVTSGSFANSAYSQANTATTNAATADQKAVTSGDYANSAFGAANTADQKAVTSGVYANAAYTQANTATTNAATADQKAVTSGDYANSAYAHANTKFSSSGGTISGNVTVGTFVDFTTGLDDPTHKEGRVYYDSGSKSLAYYNDDSQSYIHAGQDLVTRVWNNSGVTLPRANCVFISGTSSANGFPSVKLASADTAANSEVIGLTTGNIAPGAYGFALISGRIQGLNTSLITEGSELYLSDTEPGKFTTSIPNSPSIPLNVGYVTRSDLTDGTILVNIHLMEGQNKTTGAVLFAQNEAISEDPSNFFYDSANSRLGIGTNQPTANLHVTGDGLFTGNLTISGNLVVSNAQSITTSELTVGGNTIILNSEVTGTPTSNADIFVNRGTSPNVYIRWSESINEWVMFEDAGYPEGHILHSEKTAKTWADYTAMAAYEKSTHPIGADLANNTNEHAKAGFNTANSASAHAVSGFIQANSAFTSQNTTGVYANAAYSQANTATTNAATADQRAVTSGSYANSAYAQANTADQRAVTSGSYANSAYAKANTATTNAATADQRAVTSGSFANSAYSQANTATTNAATADQRAVTSGSYANSAFARANTSLINNGSTSTTGILFASGLVSNTSVTMNTNAEMTSTAFTTASVSQVTIDSWATATYRSAKYYCQITSGASHHVIELSMIHNGTTVYLTQYGELLTGSSLGTFDATISTGTLSVLFTPTNASTSIKLHRLLIDV